MSSPIFINGEQLAEWVASPIRHLWRMLTQQRDWPHDLDSLSGWLYLHWYTGVTPHDSTSPLARRLVARLRAAHADSRRYESDWAVQELRPDLGPGAILAARGPVRKVVSALDYYLPERPFAIPQPGQQVSVTVRQDSVMEGNWRTWNGLWSGADKDRLARFYWSVPFTGMPRAAFTFTNDLEMELPWMLKMMVDTSLGWRVDSTVLYVRSADVGAWKKPIREVHAKLKDFLGTAVPPLARPLVPGLAAAEDPLTPESFGEDRCHRIAEAVIEWPESLHDPNDFAASIQKTFRAGGLDLRQPDRRAVTPLQSREEAL